MITVRNRIELITLKDVTDFVNAVSKVEGEVYLVDKNRKYKVSAKSQLAAMLASAEWKEIHIESDVDCYELIKKWVI
jgi:hypothetical protein